MYDIADCRLFSLIWERNKHQYYENSDAVAATESYMGKIKFLVNIYENSPSVNINFTETLSSVNDKLNCFSERLFEIPCIGKNMMIYLSHEAAYENPGHAIVINNTADDPILIIQYDDKLRRFKYITK